eukprot:9124671-Pyramimonas_sp.AAC.1
MKAAKKPAKARGKRAVMRRPARASGKGAESRAARASRANGKFHKVGLTYSGKSASPPAQTTTLRRLGQQPYEEVSALSQNGAKK